MNVAGCPPSTRRRWSTAVQFADPLPPDSVPAVQASPTTSTRTAPARGAEEDDGAGAPAEDVSAVEGGASVVDAVGFSTWGRKRATATAQNAIAIQAHRGASGIRGTMVRRYPSTSGVTR